MPLPSTVSSSSGRMRGWRSMVTREQPWSRSGTATSDGGESSHARSIPAPAQSLLYNRRHDERDRHRRSVRGRGGPPQGPHPPDARHHEPLVRRSVRLLRLLQVREPPAGGRLQDPRRAQQAPDAHRRGARARRRRLLLRQPRPGRRARRQADRRIGHHPDADRRAGLEGGGHEGLRRGGGLLRPADRGPRGAREGAGGEDGPRPRAALRRSRDHGGAGDGGARAAGRRPRPRRAPDARGRRRAHGRLQHGGEGAPSGHDGSTASRRTPPTTRISPSRRASA